MIRDDDGVRADFDGLLGVFGIENAFEYELARPMLTNPSEIVPRHARVELAVHPILELSGGSGPWDRGLEIAECEWFAAHPDVQHPARPALALPEARVARRAPRH